jgi:hypothetical protein
MPFELPQPDMIVQEPDNSIDPRLSNHLIAMQLAPVETRPRILGKAFCFYSCLQPYLDNSSAMFSRHTESLDGLEKFETQDMPSAVDDM